MTRNDKKRAGLPRILWLLGLTVILVSACRFLIDTMVAWMPEHAETISEGVLVLFCPVLVVFIMKPMLEEFGYGRRARNAKQKP